VAADFVVVEIGGSENASIILARPFLPQPKLSSTPMPL
jgi:hypothetical protein